MTGQEETEHLLRRAGLRHGEVSEWVHNGDAYRTYYAQVDVQWLKGWCYVQIWRNNSPDVYLCLSEVHKDAYGTARGALIYRSFWSWRNIEQWDKRPGLDTDILCAALKALCE